MYDNYGAPGLVDASGRAARSNCHTLRANLMGRRRGATADGAIVMVVWEVDARAVAVGGGGRFGRWRQFGG